VVEEEAEQGTPAASTGGSFDVTCAKVEASSGRCDEHAHIKGCEIDSLRNKFKVRGGE